MESKEKEINVSVEAESTEEVVADKKPVDGYHNPNDLKMIRSLQVALRQAGDEIKSMEKENQQQKVDLSDKEELIVQASSKLDDQEKLIEALKLEKDEIIANKGSVKMQEEISKAIELVIKSREKLKNKVKNEKRKLFPPQKKKQKLSFLRQKKKLN